VNIYWTAPTANGLPITSYILEIRTSQNTYLQDLADCDASQISIVTTTQCIVKLSTLTAAPYSLELNEAINLRVAAVNAYGMSDYSPIGFGALV
jgi:hypothetical protein